MTTHKNRLQLNLQFFSKKDDSTYWYDVFLSEVATSKYKDETMKLVEEVEALSKKQTIELVQNLNDKVEEAKIPETFKEKLFRRIRIFETRLKRGVPESFGPMLRHLRESKGFTLRELGKRSGVTSSYIQRLESGRKLSPSEGVVESLSEALGHDIMQLIEKDYPKQEDAQLGVQEIVMSNSFSWGDHEATVEEKRLLVQVLDIIENGESDGLKGQENLIRLSHKVSELRNTLTS